MHVELRVEARNDLLEAAAFYESKRDGLGRYFLNHLFADLQSLESQGGIHERAYGLHRKLAERFPFAIYYRIDESTVDVVAILDCRRDPDMIAQRLGKISP